MADIECMPMPPSTDWLVPWCQEHRRLVEYLAMAEKRIRHGRVTAVICDGQIVSVEVYDRQRLEIVGSTGE